MEQKDYLLREIEKIGLLLRLIFNKITGGNENFALTTGKHFEEEKGLLLHETGFDLDLFLSLEKSEIESYVSKYYGINVPNIGLLADIMMEAGKKSEDGISINYSDKALILFELCNVLDKTFSFDREQKITELKKGFEGTMAG